MISRRGLIVAICGMAATKATAAPVGFHVRGELTALESEKLEGYAQIGDFGLSAHPRSGAVFQNLMALVGSNVHVYVEPE